MKYKLIAIDMDGTLLNSQNIVSKKNSEALYKAKEQGLYVILSTGRILTSALYYGQAIELGDPIIACNGAIVSSGNGDNILYDKSIEVEASKELIKLAEENHIYYHFYDRDTFYTREIKDDVVRFYDSYDDNLGDHKMNIEVLDDPVKFLDRKPSIYKFVFIDNDKEKLLDFRMKLSYINGVEISSSWENNIEVMSSGISKGYGLKYLIDTLNIDKSQVVAIGDNENDIPMFKISGLSIAMGNGESTIKKNADIVTDTNDENGVAKAIEKHVLNI